MMMADDNELNDAKATLSFAIFIALFREMPTGSYPYLEQAAYVAAKAVRDTGYIWALEVLAERERSQSDD
jgi:hypothetical protein